jgi:CBS domain-containing protein
MATIKNVLQRKGRNVHTIEPERSLLDALKKMAEFNIGALLVMEGNRLLGVFSERDFARWAAGQSEVKLSTPVATLMTNAKIYYAELGHTVDECLKLMTSKHIRHLPVLEHGKVVGIVSINDLVREIIIDREDTIKSLENFITGQSSIG